MTNTNKRFKAVKGSLSPEKIKELKANLNNHIQTYINSGGQIQQCTPCTYSEKEKATERQVALSKTKGRK